MNSTKDATVGLCALIQRAFCLETGQEFQIFLGQTGPISTDPRIRREFLSQFGHEKLNSCLKSTGEFGVGSLSHTVNSLGDGVVLCCSLKCNNGFVSVGVDIEGRDRRIPIGIEKRVLSIQEQALFQQIEFLDFWVLKEAAFKTKREGVITDFQVTAFNCLEKSGPFEWRKAKINEMEGLVVHFGALTLGFAVLRK